MLHYTIRPYHSQDLLDLYRICLRTGHYGADASAIYHDPDLLGHYYAAPYAVLEPDLCFVLIHDGSSYGYILGTADTMTFYDRCEQEWFPSLRKRYPLPQPTDRSPDADLIRCIHDGFTADPALRDYPAHLHINLLPEAQGQGCGTALIHTFCAHLRARGVRAVHLEVATRNARAVHFYKQRGFHPIITYPESIVFGMSLT